MDALIFAKGWRSPPSRTLLDHWAHYAVPIVLSMFSFEVAGQRNYGRMAFLPQMLSHCSDDSPLVLCCQALAFAFLANKAGSSEAESIRDELYGQALAATNRLVGDSNFAKEDETSVSVWLLSTYEVSYYQTRFKSALLKPNTDYLWISCFGSSLWTYHMEYTCARPRWTSSNSRSQSIANRAGQEHLLAFIHVHANSIFGRRC